MMQDIGDLTRDVGFKFFFKDNSLRYYVASIVADILHKEYDYVINNMHYLDVELVGSIKSLMRSDVIIEVDDVILIIEMNRNYIKNLSELKIRYANHVFDKMFYLNKNDKIVFNGKKVILVFINAYRHGDIEEIASESKYKILSEVGKELTKHLAYLEFNLEKIKELWYSKVTISKQSKRLLYLLMSRESKEEIEKFIEGDEILMKAEKTRNDLENGKIYLDYDVEMENEFIKNAIREEALEEGQTLGRAEGIVEGIAEGRAQGIAQNNRENAKKMKENGIAIDLISKITGLSKKQIMTL